VWLNFGKPGSLEPDRTSIATYVQAEEVLSRFVPDYRRPDPALVDRVRIAAANA